MLVAVVHINYQLVNLVEQTPEELFIMAGTANDWKTSNSAIAERPRCMAYTMQLGGKGTVFILGLLESP